MTRDPIVDMSAREFQDRLADWINTAPKWIIIRLTDKDDVQRRSAEEALAGYLMGRMVQADGLEIPEMFPPKP